MLEAEGESPKEFLKRHKIQRRQRLPTIGEVTFQLHNFPEDDIDYRREFRGQPQVVRWITRQLNMGNDWAWCRIDVEAKFTDKDGTEFEGNAYLGACSYRSAQDFIGQNDYYPQKRQEAYDDLIDTMKRAYGINVLH